MTNKQKAIERYFKAIGWSEATIVGYKGTYWQQSDDEDRWDVITGGDLPDIIDHYPSFKKWVLEKMGGDRFTLEFDGRWGTWVQFKEPVGVIYESVGEEIQGNEITLAAVEAATKYWESKNADK